MDKCRLCYTDLNPEMYQHIFNTQSEPPIWKIIEQLSKLIITKNDPYTKNICGPCFNNLVKYSDFRRQILDTNYRIQHKKEQLTEKTSNDCDYFQVHYTPTSSDNVHFMIKEEQIKIEDDPLKIEIGKDPLKIDMNGIKEELNNSSVAIVDNQDIKELTIVDGINNNDKMTPCFTSPEDNSNETNENIDDKIVFNRNSTETDGSYTISTNNNDLKLTDNADMIISDRNEISTAKDIVGSSKSFDDNSSYTHSNYDNNVKKEESDVEMSTNNFDNPFDTKRKTPERNSESTKKCMNARYNLNMNLKVHNRKTLQNHERTQTHEIPLKCNLCNNESSDETTLCRHEQVHPDKKTYRCNVCNKQFSYKSYLRIHSRIHTGEKPFKCDVCNKQFSAKPNLYQHRRIHTGEKPFKCNICNKQFSQKVHLLNHEGVHRDERPYKCNICDKSFKARSTLKEHLIIHTGQKPYCCNICNKIFSFRSCLNKHLKVHRNGKEFVCDICNKQFTRKDILNYHLRTHTGEKPYKCDVCNKAFENSHNLSRHNKRMHLVEKS